MGKLINDCPCDFSQGIEPDELLDYTGRDDWYAVYTVQLGELVECGVFDWSLPILDWSSAAFDEDQYSRVCEYFIARFMYREISIEPFEEWARMLQRKLVFELMPKYNDLYARMAEGVNPLSSGNEYYKNRTIDSAYPETLLSANADYITEGKDEEYQRIQEGDYVDQMVKYADLFKPVDEMLLDELETMFICMYTANVNACW